MLQPRERLLEYSVDHIGEHFYIRTNLDALNFRLMRTHEKASGKHELHTGHVAETFFINTQCPVNINLIEIRTIGHGYGRQRVIIE